MQTLMSRLHQLLHQALVGRGIEFQSLHLHMKHLSQYPLWTIPQLMVCRNLHISARLVKWSMCYQMVKLLLILFADSFPAVAPSTHRSMRHYFPAVAPSTHRAMRHSNYAPAPSLLSPKSPLNRGYHSPASSPSTSFYKNHHTRNSITSPAPASSYLVSPPTSKQQGLVFYLTYVEQSLIWFIMFFDVKDIMCCFSFHYYT